MHIWLHTLLHEKHVDTRGDAGNVRHHCPGRTEIRLTLYLLILRRFRGIAKSDYRFRQSVCLPVWPLGTTRSQLDLFSWNLVSVEKTLLINIGQERITGTLHEHMCKFKIISRWILLDWEIFQTKLVLTIKTHIMFNFFFENRAVYEIMWKNIVLPNRPQTKI